MDSIVFVGGIVLFVLIGPWVLVWRVNVRRKRERGEDQGQWRELASRVSALERTLHTLRAQLSSPAPEGATPKTPERPVAVSYTPPSSSPSTLSPPTAPTAVQPTASVRVTESWATQKAAESATTRYSSTTDRVIHSGHELAKQAGHRHPGAWCRVLSGLPTQDARSCGQSSGRVRDRRSHAGSGDLV